MFNFRNDYSQGAHPRVLEAVAACNLEGCPGYGADPHCERAAGLIRQLCAAPDAAVHFFIGGTAANLTAIAAFLRPWECVLAPDTGHINVHEGGAAEAAGHKILGLPTPDGKLRPTDLAPVLDRCRDTAMVLPRMVYISNATEVGTVYTKPELTALSEFCRAHGLLLFLDGARLGTALTSEGCSVTLPDLAALTDAFYIGGTKNGALFGEALVLPKPRSDFRWYMKRRGAMLAKGRLLGIQFQALLEDGTFLSAARHANEMALRLRDGIAALGYPLPVESPSNQQFPVLPNDVIEQLQDMGYQWEISGAVDAGHTQIRLVTSWATPEQAVEDFLWDLSVCSGAGREAH